MADIDRKKIDARFRQMEQDAQSWIPVWKDLKRWGNPTRGFFDGDDPREVRKIDHKRILNNKFIRDLRTAAAGLHSGLTSPSRPWFKLTVGDPELSQDAHVRQWLDDVEKRIYAVFNTSNIYKVLPMMYAELLQFGTAASPVEENFDHIFFCKSLTCGQYYLDVDEYGSVNSFARRIDMSVQQLVNAFGYDNCPQQIRSLWDRNQVSKMFVVHHLIEPNDNRIKGAKSFEGKAYRSIYWLPKTDTREVLRVGGFDEFPIIAPRWEITTTSDIYGVSPAMYTMGDQKTLQEMERRGLIGLAKVVDPPVAITGTSKLVNTMPGGVNVFDPNISADAGAKAMYQVNIDFDHLNLYAQRIEQRIDEMLYVDLFRMILNSDQVQPVTAREIVERHEEKMMNLGPVLESMNQELHAPLIKRVFNIMMRGGLIPDPPPDLEQQMLKVDFISVLAQAQQMVATTSIQQSLGFIGNIAGLFQDVVDVVNIDAAAKEYMQATGMPASCIRSDEEIEAIRQQKQEAAAAEQQMQQASTIVAGAKTLSDASLDGNNALTALTGLGGGMTGG